MELFMQQLLFLFLFFFAHPHFKLQSGYAIDSLFLVAIRAKENNEATFSFECLLNLKLCAR